MALSDLKEISVEHSAAIAYVESLFRENEFSKVLLDDFQGLQFTAVVPKNFEFIKPIDLKAPLQCPNGDSEWVAALIQRRLCAFQEPVLFVDDCEARESDFAELFGKIFHSEWRLNSAIYSASIEGDLAQTIEHLFNICRSFEPIIFVIEESKFNSPSPIQRCQNAFVVIPVFDGDSYLIGRTGNLL